MEAREKESGSNREIGKGETEGILLEVSGGNRKPASIHTNQYLDATTYTEARSKPQYQIMLMVEHKH